MTAKDLIEKLSQVDPDTEDARRGTLGEITSKNSKNTKNSKR
jgi:hypothetical protein